MLPYGLFLTIGIPRCRSGFHKLPSNLHPRTAQPVSGHGEHDDAADDDLLDIVGPSHQLAAITQEGHDESADHLTQDTALAAGQAAPANHHGGDDIELHSHSHGRIALTQARHLHHSRESEQ